MKRSPLRRHKPLRPSTPVDTSNHAGQAEFTPQRSSQPQRRTCPARTSPLRQQSAKRRARQAEWRVARAVVYARSGGWCEICGIAITRDAWECHHRKFRSQGGDDSATNLLACCPGPAGCHHARIHGGDRLDVEARGWIVRRADDPAQTPALVAGRGRVLLTATGYVHPGDVA